MDDRLKGITVTGGEATAFKALTLDVELYQRYFDDPSLSVEEKREMVRALWSMMVGFVDLGFGIHPLQQAKEGNGNTHETQDHSDEGKAFTAPCRPSVDPKTPENQMTKTVDHPVDDQAAARET